MSAKMAELTPIANASVNIATVVNPGVFEKLPHSKSEILHHKDPFLFSLRCSLPWLWIQHFCAIEINFFCVTESCPSSHNDAMRTGPAVIVQRGDFVIAGDCGPLENLIRCCFANELLAGEPKNL